jgi:hypothetical protein
VHAGQHGIDVAPVERVIDFTEQVVICHGGASSSKTSIRQLCVIAAIP